MSGGITWPDLGFAIGFVIGFGALLFGVLAALAAGMSANPRKGAQVCKQGCAVQVAGLICAGLCLAALAS